MKKMNAFFLMAMLSIASLSAQTVNWAYGGLTADPHAYANGLYATRLQYKIYEAPATWDPTTQNVMDVWAGLAEGYSLNKYFVDAAKKRNPADAADFTATVKYMYDLDNLYVMYKVTDDYIFPLDSAKQETFEVMYAPYADSIKLADLYVLDPAFATSSEKDIPAQSFGYWGKAGAYKTGYNAKASGDSYIDFSAAYTGAINWGAPIAGIGITTKFAKLSATEYTFMVTIPFVEGMAGFVPAGGKRIAVEAKIKDVDTGKPLNIEAAANTNNNDLYIHMCYAGVGVFQGTTGLKNVKESIFSIYPNPTADVLNIKNADLLKQVVISDLAGRQLKTYNTVSSSLKLGLSKGSYLIQLVGKDNATETQKLVVK